MQWKIAPALAAGNTIVLKPSEMASVSCLELGEIAVEAGLPAGVLNIVTGLGTEAGAPLRSVLVNIVMYFALILGLVGHAVSQEP